jgi:hypothetical protein
MATKDALEVDSLTRQLTALKVQASSRSVPDARLNKQIMDLQQQLMKKKSASVDSPTTALRKGGVVKKNKPVKKMAEGGMSKKQTAKVGKVMGEFKEGKLHSGKNGKVVKDKGQAIAIALAQARKAKK